MAKIKKQSRGAVEALRLRAKYHQVNYDDLNITSKTGFKKLSGRINRVSAIQGVQKSLARRGVNVTPYTLSSLHYQSVRGLYYFLRRESGERLNKRFTTKEINKIKGRSERDRFILRRYEETGGKITQAQALQEYVDLQKKKVSFNDQHNAKGVHEWVERAIDAGMQEVADALRVYGQALVKEFLNVGFDLISGDYDSPKNRNNGLMDPRIEAMGYDPTCVTQDVKEEMEEKGSVHDDLWGPLQEGTLNEFYYQRYNIAGALEEVRRKYGGQA